MLYVCLLIIFFLEFSLVLPLLFLVPQAGFSMASSVMMIPCCCFDWHVLQFCKSHWSEEGVFLTWSFLIANHSSLSWQAILDGIPDLTLTIVMHILAPRKQVLNLIGLRLHIFRKMASVKFSYSNSDGAQIFGITIRVQYSRRKVAKIRKIQCHTFS